MPNVSPTAAASQRQIPPFFARAGILCLVGFAALNGLMIWRVHTSIFEGYGDFASFYTAGMLVRDGHSAGLYNPRLQWNAQQQFASEVRIRRGPLPYIRPPFQAFMFLPLAWMRYPIACIAWLAFKIILLLGFPFLLPAPAGGFSPLKTYALRVLVCLSFFAVGFDLLQGQDSILLLVIMALVLRLLLRGKELQAGAALALGLFKFHLIVPFFLIFVLLRRGKIVVGFVAAASALFLISLNMVGWPGIVNYPRYLQVLNQVPGLGMVQGSKNMPNFRGLVTVLMGRDPLPPAIHWALAVIVMLGVVIAARAWRGTDPSSIVTAFCFSIVVILVTSYYANNYDMTLLLLPLLLLGERFLFGGEIAGWPRTVFLISAGLLLLTPLMWVLAVQAAEFCWAALILVALAIAIAAAMGMWNGSKSWGAHLHEA